MSETLVRMPKLADTLVEGTLAQWLKRVGDEVRRGEPLASIETDKVTTELTSPAAGTLLEVLVGDGQTVPIETPIARIAGAEGASRPTEGPSREAEGPSRGAEQTSRQAEGASQRAEAASRQIEAPSPAREGPSRQTIGPSRAGQGPSRLGEPPSRPGAAVPPRAEPSPGVRKPTPVAARLLAEHGLKPADIAIESGRLTKGDVLAFIARAKRPAPAAALPDGGLVPLTSLRRAIAEHMLKARQTIPHGQCVMEVDLTQVVAWREAEKTAFQEQHGANLTFTVLFVHALARRLAAYLGGPADLGVAVALEAGLIVPVLRGADSLSLAETARGVADLAGRARANKLAPDEVQGARMTLTNVGSFGNLTASPLVPLGQLGILGPGLVERRPLPAPGGGIRVGWRCLLSLMFDRRAFDDYAADRFLRGIVDELVALPTRGEP
jgi:2-oxoglutarate dehydrogenase E2 component (dihydrolipoamide succinyltransferase)